MYHSHGNDRNAAPVCAMHAILGKLVLIHAATEGGWLVHYFAIQTIPDKHLFPI